MASERLAGRRIVVTGAASGMGEAVARRFTQEGAALLLLDINAETLEAVGAATGQRHRKCDVSNEADVEAALAFANETLGGIDGLVNVAGVLGRKPVRETSFADFQRIVGVNLGGPFLTCRLALPYLEAADRSTIVNVSSLSGIRSQPGMAVYSATKAGLIAFSEAFSGELGPTVRINTVCPGVIRTPMTDFMFEGGGSEATISKMVRVGRLGTGDDVADACLYLTSHESAFVSAATLSVTGGHFRAS